MELWTILAGVLGAPTLLAVVRLIETGYERHRASVARRDLRSRLAAGEVVSEQAAVDGPVRIEGKAVAGALLTAPLSGKPVIGYRLRIARGPGDGAVTSQGAAILDVACLQEFFVDDGSAAAARVCPARCLPLFTSESPVAIEAGDLVRSPLKEIVDRCMLPGSALVSASSFVGTEYLLEPGEMVFVFGEATHELDPAAARAGYREPPLRLVVSAPAEGFLVVADRDRDELLQNLREGRDLIPPDTTL